PGDTEHGRDPLGRCAAHPLQEVRGQLAEFGAGDGTGDGEPVTGQDGVGVGRPAVPQVDVALPHHRVDHPGQAHPLAVLGGEDGDAAPAQPVDLLGHDHTAAPADHADVPGPALAQRLDEVLEVLDVPALVGRDRHAVHVLL